MKNYICFLGWTTTICFITIICAAKYNSKINNIKLTNNHFNHKIELSNDFKKNSVLQENLEYINNYKNLGQGVVNPIDFSFTLILDTISMDSIRIKNIEEPNILRPIFYKPDYLIFYLVVRNITNNYYLININEDQLGFVRKNEFNYFTWKNLFLNEINSLIIKNGYTKRGNDTQPIEFSDEDYFICIDFDNDWLRVEKENDPHNKYWVKWKTNNGLNVEPIFLD